MMERFQDGCDEEGDFECDTGMDEKPVQQFYFNK